MGVAADGFDIVFQRFDLVDKLLRAAGTAPRYFSRKTVGRRGCSFTLVSAVGKWEVVLSAPGCPVHSSKWAFLGIPLHCLAFLDICFGLCLGLALVAHGLKLIGLDGQDMSMHGLDMHEIVTSWTWNVPFVMCML